MPRTEMKLQPHLDGPRRVRMVTKHKTTRPKVAGSEADGPCWESIDLYRHAWSRIRRRILGVGTTDD